MRIALLVEGDTERAFIPVLRAFLHPRLEQQMPRLKPVVYDGRIPKGEKLKRIVDNLLAGREACDAVIALTDVYTGTTDFADATDAKVKMSEWAGPNRCFYAHVAQHDFEAWLLPFWSEIQRLAGHNRRAPAGPPEGVNHRKPPSVHVKEIFRLGTCRDDYVKPRDALRILRGKDLGISAAVCPELKAFLNTILQLCGGESIP